MTNPWLTRPAETVEPVAEEPPAAPATGPTTPHGPLVTMPGPLRVQQVFHQEPVRLWLTGAHGGAGVTTLSGLLDGYDGERTWPGIPVPTLLVARTSLAGLTAAQAAARQWAGRGVPALQQDLLGLVLLADAPGRLPRPLQELAALITGGVPRVWRLPWMEEWRVGEQPRTQPRPVRHLLQDVSALVNPITAQEAPRA